MYSLRWLCAGMLAPTREEVALLGVVTAMFSRELYIYSVPQQHFKQGVFKGIIRA